jgi:EAL domain-containing protein (putative c-di-GMP-specific phosphodiesterase class I)
MTRHIPFPGARRPARGRPIGYGVAAAIGGWILVQWAPLSLLPYLLTAAAAAAVLAGLSLAARRRRRGRVDEATGLPNFLALERAAAARPDANVVVAQIDRFAVHAASLGQLAAARLVARIAERLAFGSGGRPIFRLDEASLAWLEAPGDEDSLEDRLDALAALMRSPVDCGRPVDVSLAFGLATGPDGDIRKRIVKASLAARNAAHFGMRWKRSADEGGADGRGPVSLPHEFDGAIASGQLWVAYQPQLDIRGGRFEQVEALVRWLHPRCGPISPGSFVPVVEAHGRARDLTLHVLAQALEDAQRWDEAGFPVGIALNMSTLLLADHEFIETIGLILRSSRVATHRITVEVAAAAALASPDRAIAALESWRSHGMDVAISGYGACRSPLGFLGRLPATRLKIDKNPVRPVAVDPSNAAAVRAAILLAHSLGMTVVAEGVEDAACLAALGEMGCDIAQGYHIARPMTGKALTEFLAERARAAA